ncbi:hypothetical protein DH2020_037888 [Rehmannia glutinosa]|uniref:Uncharacterized protein n=1 Tax=Rehmannia glutinosa TaxID=99300 RepID=A0ABR0V0G4_REHGL
MSLLSCLRLKALSGRFSSRECSALLGYFVPLYKKKDVEFGTSPELTNVEAVRKLLPGTAQVAFQQADFAGWNLWAAINGRPLLPFSYHTSIPEACVGFQNLGEMMTLGRCDAAISTKFHRGVTLEGPVGHTARKIVIVLPKCFPDSRRQYSIICLDSFASSTLSLYLELMELLSFKMRTWLACLIDGLGLDQARCSASRVNAGIEPVVRESSGPKSPKLDIKADQALYLPDDIPHVSAHFTLLVKINGVAKPGAVLYLIDQRVSTTKR